MALTNKQIKFCDLVLKGNTAMEAYRQAYNNQNTSTCKVNASKLLKQPLIASRMSELTSINRRITEAANEKAISKVINIEIASVAERKGILTKIARGEIPLTKPMVCNGKIELVDVVPDYMDRKNAIAELNKMDGDYAPSKLDITSEGESLIIEKRLIGQNTNNIPSAST